MPDESCRMCGGSLVNCTLCPSCRKITQRICNICGVKTREQVHSHRTYLESSRTTNGMMINVVLAKSSKSMIYQKNSGKINALRNMLLVFGIAGFFALGFATANYFDLFQYQTNEIQIMKTSITPQPLQNHDNSPRRSFENCLAYGSGQSMTITCPTEYGYVYRAILTIPEKLASEFSNQVFSIRGISVVEYSGGLVVVQYHNNLYTTSFFGN